jgi:hypothetical protein
VNTGQFGGKWVTDAWSSLWKRHKKLLKRDSHQYHTVSATQYTIMVTPSLGGKHSNVAITVETNPLTGTASTLTDISDNGNTHTALLFCGAIVPIIYQIL